MKKPKKHIIIKISIGIFTIFLFGIIGLYAYSLTGYNTSSSMYDAIELLDISDINVNEKAGAILYTVEDPLKQIIWIPGGLVEPNSYRYLAVSLALNGYNVTIVKPLFELAIIPINQASRYINNDLDNVIVGHSLGGVVAGMAASKSDLITHIVLLASYPISDLTEKDVLMITASHDLVTDQTKLDESLTLLNDTTTFKEIIGGNHAQFGWYGPQKGDGEATITTIDQQDIIVAYILDFIDNQGV